jgi:hypothetical protein
MCPGREIWLVDMGKLSTLVYRIWKMYQQTVLISLVR